MAEASTTEELANKPKGLGGWLILPIIGTVLAPFLLAYFAIQDLFVVLGPEGHGLDSTLAAALWGGIVITAVFILAYIYANILLFRKNHLFPNTFIGLAIAALVWSVAQAFVAVNLFDIELTTSDTRDIARQTGNCLIWIPYMLMSKRVKNTFVEI